MPRYKKASHLHVNKRHGTKRPRPAAVFKGVSPSPFRKRLKGDLKVTPIKLVRTPSNREKLLTPMACSPMHVNACTISSSKRKLKFEKLIRTPVNRVELLSPKVCSPMHINARTSSSSKRKLKFEKGPVPNTGPSDDVDNTCALLRNLVKSNRFSTESISFKLFQDSLRWHSIHNTSCMRYSEEVKEFFWTGRRLLGGQFVRFMRGYAHAGKVTQGLSPRGTYDPTESDINLPVPSDRLLDDFRPRGIAISSILKPGIIRENIELYSKHDDVSYTLMFDGKKIVPGTADVYLLGQEDEPKLSQMSDFFNTKVEKFNECIELLDDISSVSGNIEIDEVEDNNRRKDLINKLKELLKELSSVTKSIRETYVKKKFYLQTLEKKFAEKGEPKLKFAINKIKTFLYRLRICLKDLLGVTDNLLLSCAILNGKRDMFSTNTCNLETQQNYRELKSPSEIKETIGDDNIPSNLVKQRTPEWFALRKTVKVTGSTLHKAIGLETLAAQKQHFDEVVGKKQPPSKTGAQIEAMNHGSLNEENAIATIVSKVLPTFYPECIFVEEGAYVVHDEQGNNVLVVSPDGSLCDNENKRIVSVEIKCPYPFFDGATPVYYDLKKRHILQCYAEAEVMDCVEHLYVSWSKESMTVFKLKPNRYLTQKAFKESIDTFYQDVPRRPTKLSDTAKSIKESLTDEANNAEFLCEVPSVEATHVSTWPRKSGSIYHEPVQTPPKETELHIEDVIQTCMKANQLIEDAHKYQKPIASEVLIHLLSDMDRSWNLEIGHGLPISFLYKGYSLTMATSRRILEEILTVCFQKGVHVACVAFDGQFAQIKDIDSQDRPLTLFACQRQYWSNVKKMNKRELINAVNESFQDVTVHKQLTEICDNDGNTVVRKGAILVTNSKLNIRPIKTHPELIQKVVAESDAVNDVIPDTNGLEEDVANIVESVVLSTTSTHESENSRAFPDIETRRQTQPEESYITDNNDTSSIQDGTVMNEFTMILDENDFSNMFTLLCSSTQSRKWQGKSVDDMKIAFESAGSMNKYMTGQDIHEILKYLNVKLTKNNLNIKQSLRKGEKINRVFELLGKASKVEVKPTARRRHKIKSLKSMCIQELNKRKYQKDAIATAFAESNWLTEESKWYKSHHVCVEQQVKITDEKGELDTVFMPVYSPEYNEKRREMQVRIMDGTHMRTNIKSKIIRSGINKINSTAWKEVAKEGNTLLTPSLLEVSQEGKLIHQQSDPHVRTMFAEDVEFQLRLKGYNEEADFCHLFREWHEAEDRPGLSAHERVTRSLNLRTWLLDGYSFQSFPPKTQYVKGIPRVTFEGLVTSIDAHILLYGICKGQQYNWRSASTLVAENFMGELAERSQNNHGVPSGQTLAADMTRISELHAMRLNPKRPFHMRTARSRAYTVPDLDIISCSTTSPDTPDSTAILEKPCAREQTQECITGQESDTEKSDSDTVKRPKITHVMLRNHEFDKRVGGKAKIGTVRKFLELPRGVQSVRSHYKVDESKLLPSLSLGLTEDAIDTI